jgi:perosamine synthetase
MDPIINRSARRYIPVARPALGKAEADAAANAIAAGWAAGGPCVAEFQRQFAIAHGKRYGVACNSGTSALQLALAALDVSAGDEVVVPTLTMVAVANAVLYRGATPVFVDSDPESGNPDAQWLRRGDVISARTKAAIVPHLYGVPAEAFLDTLARHAPHVAMVEDCAEAHYATFADGKPAGSRGRLACWSFYGNKIVTTGEGGLVAADDRQTAGRLLSLRSHAFTPHNHFHHRELAYGYRMSEMQAAVGLAQHARRAELLARRSALALCYVERLSQIAWLTFQARTLGSADWVMPVLADTQQRRAAVRENLAAQGVETRNWFVALHRQPHLRRFATAEYPIAEALSRRGLYLPLWPGMTDADVELISDVVALS